MNRSRLHLVAGILFGAIILDPVAALAAADSPKTAKPAAAAKAASCKLNDKGITAVKVKLTTNMDDIMLALDNENATLSNANSVKYAESGHYKITIFQR